MTQVSTYLKLSGGLILLIMFWFFAPPGTSLAIKVLVSAIVVSSAIKNVRMYLDYSRSIR